MGLPVERTSSMHCAEAIVGWLLQRTADTQKTKGMCASVEFVHCFCAMLRLLRMNRAVKSNFPRRTFPAPVPNVVVDASALMLVPTMTFFSFDFSKCSSFSLRNALEVGRPHYSPLQLHNSLRTSLRLRPVSPIDPNRISLILIYVIWFGLRCAVHCTLVDQNRIARRNRVPVQSKNVRRCARNGFDAAADCNSEQ